MHRILFPVICALLIAGLGIGTGLTYQMPSVIIRAKHPIRVWTFPLGYNGWEK